MLEPKILIELYGRRVADGGMRFSEALNRLMRKEVLLGTEGLDGTEDRLSTQLVNSIENKEKAADMDDTQKAKADLNRAKEYQRERAAAFLAATMAAGLQQRQTRRPTQDSEREKVQKPRQPRL
jgi:hypothetical protein